MEILTLKFIELHIQMGENSCKKHTELSLKQI